MRSPRIAGFLFPLLTILPNSFAATRTPLAGLQNGFAFLQTHFAGLQSGFAILQTHFATPRAPLAISRGHSRGFQATLAIGKRKGQPFELPLFLCLFPERGMISCSPDEAYEPLRLSATSRSRATPSTLRSTSRDSQA